VGGDDFNYLMPKNNLHISPNTWEIKLFPKIKRKIIENKNGLLSKEMFYIYILM
jgi:hypothetical protein